MTGWALAEPRMGSSATPARPPGPAVQRLRDYLRENRPRLSPLLRVTLGLSAASVAGMVVTLALAFIVDVHTGLLVLEFVGITTVSGPQAATLFVFSQEPPLGIGWVVAMSTLNMAATLFLIVPLAWRGFERLRDARVVGGLVRSAERFSVKHRKFLARWGLIGLVLVTLAPVQGGGVLGAGILGVLLRIPLVRLLVSVALSGALLNLAWTLVIFYTEEALPSGGIYDLLPYAVIGAIVAAGLVASWRGHKRRFQFQVETIPGTPAAQQAKLNSVGIVEEDYVLRADLREVCQDLGIPESDLVRARNTAELLRLDNLPPKAGERLTAAGIVSIREVALAPAELVRDALEEIGGDGFKVPSLAEVEAWRAEAQRFEAEFHKQVHAHTPGGAPVL